jgi:hypothetical protein
MLFENKFIKVVFILSVIVSIPFNLFAGVVFLGENTLLAAPCDNDGDIIIEGGEVLSRNKLNCISRGGSVSILPGANGKSFKIIAGDSPSIIKAVDANSEEHTTWAQTECHMSNDPDVIDDCNYSAYHVVDQFCDAWGHCGSGYGNGVDYKKTVYEWKFAWSSNYPPGGGNPDGYFDPAPGESASTAHIQGFIRTNDDEYIFAGSHSNRTDRAGTVFFININDSDELRLNSVYRTYGKNGDLERHPVGVQVLGDYVFTELKNRYLTLYNVENVKYDHDNQEQNEIFHDFLMKEGNSKVKNSEDLIDAGIKFSKSSGPVQLLLPIFITNM